MHQRQFIQSQCNIKIWNITQLKMKVKIESNFPKAINDLQNFTWVKIWKDVICIFNKRKANLVYHWLTKLRFDLAIRELCLICCIALPHRLLCFTFTTFFFENTSLGSWINIDRRITMQYNISPQTQRLIVVNKQNLNLP